MNVIMETWNVYRGPSNVNRLPGMLLWDRGM